MRKLAYWGSVVSLMILALGLWAYIWAEPLSPSPAMPTSVPTPVGPGGLPEASSKATVQPIETIETLSDLQVWMATYLYPKGRPFLQQAANQWLMMKGTYRRFTPSGSRLPSKGFLERWIRLDAQGQVQEILAIEESAAGHIVQITYAREQHQWNSLGGWVPGGPSSLEDLLGWNPTSLWNDQVTPPILWQEGASMYTLLYRARYSSPIQRFGQYTVVGREESWRYDRKTGLLLGHHQRMHVQDGRWITLWEVVWTYAIQPQLPENRLDVYNYAVTQWIHVTPP